MAALVVLLASTSLLVPVPRPALTSTRPSADAKLSLIPGDRLRHPAASQGLNPGAKQLQTLASTAALVATLGALPGPASATGLPASGLYLADAETLDVIAIIVVPLIVGGGLVAFLAANYEKFIDKINEGR